MRSKVVSLNNSSRNTNMRIRAAEVLPGTKGEEVAGEMWREQGREWGLEGKET